jgi:hypothetical protein
LYVNQHPLSLRALSALTTGLPSLLRPLATHELSMPTQNSLWRHTGLQDEDGAIGQGIPIERLD